ncbi:hypothetical protein [Pseudoalteromonas phage J2-1_QLiu-2017]|nr:hypothetical protein [Pseudoalteromonas phage J2-1_QLiu-2017]
MNKDDIYVIKRHSIPEVIRMLHSSEESLRVNKNALWLELRTTYSHYINLLEELTMAKAEEIYFEKEDALELQRLVHV